MKQTVHLSDFRDAFRSMGRGDSFSYEALELLYDWFEEVDPDWELDIIEICCDYNELDIEEFIKEYDLDLEDVEEDEAINPYRMCPRSKAVEDHINNEGCLIGFTSQGTVVFGGM